MTEGTKTVLFGSHNVLMHSLFIIIAWVLLYKKVPKFWQLVCIFIHDIGYFGMNHLTADTNENHTELGAKIGYRLFGFKAWLFIVGHSRKDAEKYGVPLSELEAPDDYVWVIMPLWLISLLQYLEGSKINAYLWKQAVIENWKNPDSRVGGTDLLNSIKK